MVNSYYMVPVVDGDDVVRVVKGLNLQKVGLFVQVQSHVQVVVC